MYDIDATLNSGEKKLLRQGRFRRSLLHVPAVTPGFYVADFRISFPVEKGWLARQAKVDGFSTEELRQRVGDRLALLSGRPAFAGSFVATIQGPLTAALRALKQTDREAFDRLDEAVPEVGVLMDSQLMCGCRECHPPTVKWTLTPALQRGEHPAMALSFLYRAFSRVLQLVRLSFRSDTDLAIEVVLLRHEVAVLRRQVQRPMRQPADRAVLAGLARLLGRQRLGRSLVQPVTLHHMDSAPYRSESILKR